MTDDIVRTHSDPASAHRVQALEKWTKANPSVSVVDPISVQRTVTNRALTSNLVEKVKARLHKQAHVSVTDGGSCAVDGESTNCEAFLNKQGIHFPVVCKPIQACGSTDSHRMGVVSNEGDMRSSFQPPFVVQSFFNHDGVVFKVFVVGRDTHIVARTSLPDVDLNNKSSPPNLFVSAGLNKPIDADDQTVVFPPSEDIDAVARTISDISGLSLFGFDVLRCTSGDSASYAIVDINFFPSYKGVPNFFPLLFNHCLSGDHAQRPAPLVAGIEAGGTTFVVAVAEEDKPEHVLHRAEFPTTTPSETLAKCKRWLRQYSFGALGIASFGPVDLILSSPTYGYITTTPKPDWAQTDIVGQFKEFNCPIVFETDVNGAAFAEAVRRRELGEGNELTCCYVTVGTGVGVGLSISGRPHHGVLHPELGHMIVRRHDNEPDDFKGTCPFHGDCLEGLCASGALAKRAGLSRTALASLPDTDPVWERVAYYLGQLCCTLTLCLAPHTIVLGGGIMKRGILVDMIRKSTQECLSGYLASKEVNGGISDYIVPSVYGENAGIVGSFQLARSHTVFSA
eukprot:TRINITY_DN3852_c1_g1_i4.p1 TRINITY_DN3852_c1_g1~~TRINITY_DN3852_c1_g1_i4.p1  ORF type:complete len:567 (-),score=63.92 TRINITY_DN3852_c1_g1_i4:43-1743(-)